MTKYSHKILIVVLISVIFAISSLFLLRNISDPDFFWHIKTGEWIWQERALPSVDPFAYTSPGHHTTREFFILTSFWLSQVTYHLFYLAGGTSGIALLRFLIVGILLFTFWKRKHGDNIIYLGLIMIFLTFFLKLYPVERPQVFSFLFFAILLYLLETITREKMSHPPAPGQPHEGNFHRSQKGGASKRDAEIAESETLLFSAERAENKSDIPGAIQMPSLRPLRLRGERLLFFFPLLMMVWANMHPGFIVGQVTLIFYMIMEGIKFLHPSFRPIEKTAYKRLCLAALLGIIFSLLNPNIYHVWQQYWEYKTPVEHWNLSAAYISTLNPDYMSSIQFFVWSYDYSEILYWLIILLAIAGQVVNWKKTDITELAFLTATGYVSFIATRYSFFFMAAALPVIARSFSRDRLLNISRVVILAIALFAGIFFSWGERYNLEGLRSGIKVDNYLCPVKAADFIISNNLRGNMYNVYEWGGYLIWRLSPGRQVFIDPRDIFEETAREATLMDRANADETSGIPTWKAIARAHGIEYMVIHIAQMTGRVVPLFFALMQDNDWLPVFCDINAVIFVRDSPLNEHVMRKYSIPKDYLMNALIGLYSRLVTANPKGVNLYITLGDFYLSRTEVIKAAEAYEKALKIAPLNVIARERLGLLGKGD